MKITFFIFLFLAACAKTKTTNPEEKGLPPLAPDKNGEIFYLASSVSDDGRYRSLYYDPLSEVYFLGTMEPAPGLPGGIIPNQPPEEYAYISKRPIKHEGYTYLGAIDPLTRAYSNQSGVFFQKFKVFDPQVEASNPETGQSVMSKLYPVLDEQSPFGYLFTEFQSAYLFSPTFSGISEGEKLSREKQLNLRTNWRAYVHIPFPLTNGRPALAELARDIERGAPPYSKISLYPPLHGIPLPLQLFIKAGSQVYDGKEFLAYTNALGMAVQHYSQGLQGKASLFIQKNIYQLFPVIFLHITNYDARQLYLQSLENSDFWENYALEMPDFQWLLKAGVPMPNDLAAPVYNYQENTTNFIPILHYFAVRGYTDPLLLILEHNPGYNVRVTNYVGWTISQIAVANGNLMFLELLLKKIPGIDVHEVTPSNKTWVDLAYELPLYNFIFPEDDVYSPYEKTRSYILTNLAPKYGISNNTPLLTNFTYNPAKPRSMASLQAQYKQEHPDFQFIFPHEIRPEHRSLFEEDLPPNLSLEPFIIFSSDTFQFYPKYVHDTYARLVQFLTDGAQADYKTLDSNGNNVLAYVVQTPRKDLFEFFIAKGVSPHQINNQGESLMHIAFHNRNAGWGWDTAQGKDQTHIYLDILSDLGLDINLLDKKGNTPYSRYISSVFSRSEDIQKKFEKLGADPAKGIYPDPETTEYP